MSTSNSRFRILLSRFGTLLESVFIFILLLSGIGVVFIGKITGFLEAGIILLTFGLAVQVVAFIILGLYAYLRFLRSTITAQ
ncbi:MAG: hypothetical protein ACFFCH_01115 [Promethearchaeota archaeon]